MWLVLLQVDSDLLVTKSLGLLSPHPTLPFSALCLLFIHRVDSFIEYLALS